MADRQSAQHDLRLILRHLLELRPILERGWAELDEESPDEIDEQHVGGKRWLGPKCRKDNNNDEASVEVITEKELEERYNIPRRTAQRWRLKGIGPSFIRLGERRVAYRVGDVEVWLAERTYRHRAHELELARRREITGHERAVTSKTIEPSAIASPTPAASALRAPAPRALPLTHRHKGAHSADDAGGGS
jgi:hypothetical protein